MGSARSAKLHIEFLAAFRLLENRLRAGRASVLLYFGLFFLLQLTTVQELVRTKGLGLLVRRLSDQTVPRRYARTLRAERL